MSAAPVMTPPPAQDTVSDLAAPRRGLLRGWGDKWLLYPSIGMLVVFVLFAIFAPWIARYDPTAPDFQAVLLPPSPQHWLGTDDLGRDIWSRIVYGSRTSLIGPLAIVVFSTILGIVIGLIAGWRGGWLDAVISRILDILFAFPGLLLAMLTVALFGKGLAAPVVAMCIAYTPFVARLVRGLVISGRSRPFVQAYAVQGFGATHVAVRRVLPYVSPTVLAQATVSFGYALLELAGLSFLGLGVQPPTPDWGSMINEGQSTMLAGQPLPSVAPAIAIILTVVAFNVVGDHLGSRIARRDA